MSLYRLILCLLWLASLPCAAEPVRLTATSGFRVDLVPALGMLDPQVDTLDAQRAWDAVARGELSPLPGPDRKSVV